MGYHDIAESSWTSAAAANRGGSSGGGYTDILKEIFDRLMAKGIEEVVSDPSAFREQLHRHFERLPASYSIDLDVEKPEDVLLHRRILDECANNPDKRPVFHVRFLRRDIEIRPIHEIIFSTIDKTKLLRELSDLMSEVGLNIHEAHVFSTTDGFCLDVFVVDGWDTKETDDLLQTQGDSSTQSCLINRTQQILQPRKKILELLEKIGDSGC